MKITRPAYAMMCDPDLPCGPRYCSGRTIKEIVTNCL